MQSNRERIIDAMADQFEEVFVQMDKVKEAHQLAAARGISLDALGALTNILRLPNESDNDYRLRLQKLTSIKIGAGTKSSIIYYLENYLLLESSDFNVIEISPCFIQIQLISDLVSREAEIYNALSEAIAAGVFYEIVYEETYWQDVDAQWDTDDRWR